MAETKHTKGPWEVDSLDGCIYGQDHTCVAVPHGGAGEAIKTKPILDANASLIASAPELLEALREITKREGPYSRDHQTHANNTIEYMAGIAEAAIAKAEPK